MTPPRSTLKRVLGAVGALASGLLVTSTLFALPAPPAAEAATTNGTINGYRNVGYFAQWGVYGRDFKLKALQDSGAAGNLTAINYSFGNIDNNNLTCFMANKAQGTGPNGSDGAGDAYADYGMGYTAQNSVAGVADTWDQPLAGSFNQLKQLKAKNPGLKPIISLGGWTWSKNFSRAAATQASRQKLVSSCIDLYIKGNLPLIDGRGGPGAAAGVFDGIDIDWEWPGTYSGLEGNGVDTVNDANNFRLLLKEFRTQLDAYGSTTGKHYTLSAFLPANPADIAAGGWNNPENFTYLDYGNIQGYDLWGAWDPTLTGHQGNLYDDPADTRPAAQRFSVDKAVKAYTSKGIKPAQLGLGLATYGRGWQGVPSGKPWSPATGAAPGTYEAGNEDYDKLKNLGTDHYDATIGAAWRSDGNQWWSYDNPQTVKLKADYIVKNKLGGGMWWELSGNRDGTLIQTLTTALRQAAAGPVGGTTPTTPPVTPTPTPTPTPTTPPTTNPTPTPTPTPTTPPATDAWDATKVYVAGNRVTYKGVRYEAKWWTQNNIPGTEEWGPWKVIG
jgi:chitinase